jgi:hypothetical protein
VAGAVQSTGDASPFAGSALLISDVGSLKRRLIAVTAVLNSVFAPRMEPTAIGRIVWRRQLSPNRVCRTPASGETVEQRFRVWVRGPLEQVLDRSSFHHFPGVHDDDTVGNGRDDAEIVGDK